MTDLIKPEEFTVEIEPGVNRTYTLSSFDAIAGREIISQYPMTAIPNGDSSYKENEKLYFKLMNYVAVKLPNGEMQRLSTEMLIKNHVPDWEVGAKIEMAMMNKNCSFFRDGRSWDFLQNIAQLFIKKASEMLTRSSEQSSPKEKPHSMNSEQSTT